MSFLGLLELKVTVLLKKKKEKRRLNMQIYCLNDDRGLAGFRQTVSEGENTKRKEDER